MTLKERFFFIFLIYFLISGMTNGTFLKAVPAKTLIDPRNLSAGSDDVLESIHLLNDGGGKSEDLEKMEDDYDAIEEIKFLDDGETTQISTLETSEVTSESSVGTSDGISSSTSSSTTIVSTKSDEISSTTVASSSTTTPFPKICDYELTSDTELKFPNDELTFDKNHNVSWCFHLPDGPFVDIHVETLDLDPKTDYLIISAGNGDDDDDDEKGKFITGSHQNVSFRIIHTNRALISLRYEAKSKPKNWGFKLFVSSVGQHPSSTTPEPTTVPSFTGDLQTITKSLSIAHELQNHTDLWDVTLRNALVDATNLWRDEHNFTEFLQKCRRENVVIKKVSPCPKSWPDNLNCVRLEFGIPLNETDFNGELPEQLSSVYELTEEHLEEIWREFGIQKLHEIGMTEYFLPNFTAVLATWTGVSVGVIVFFCIVLFVIWKNDLFKGYRRMNEETEEKPRDETKQNDITMIPTPFLYGEDEFPEGFGDEFERDSSIHEPDTTIFDVRTPPPSKNTVRFAKNDQNIEDLRHGAYTNPFALEIEASEYGYRDSEC
ncbi:uncharacterized protein LOC134831867 [Culicoides brevitarsis]|uniref:uncharacterized protein LOC134831867 n=1 Tax=Culicoides brevitarsis TaxID=469753 RepID=UPI00307BB921